MVSPANAHPFVERNMIGQYSRYTSLVRRDSEEEEVRSLVALREPPRAESNLPAPGVDWLSVTITSSLSL